MIPYRAGDAKKVLLFTLQQQGGGIHPISLELASAARRLAREGDMESAGLLITGKLSEKSRAELGRLGLGAVYIYEDPCYAPFVAEYHCAALLHCAGLLKPEILLVGATPEGRILAPLAAIPLDTGVTADCTELAIEDGLLVQTRPAFGGGIMARIATPAARPQIATVRYGMLCGPDATPEAETPLIISRAAPLPESKLRAKIIEEVFTEEDSAESILALGAGVRAREDIDLFRRVCAAASMKLMCSRSLVERGWFPRSSQIGLSGRSVSPSLLVTLGISGSVQFMAGIRGAHRIIAVNTDSDAPILRAADIPLAGDLYKIAEELLKTL